MVGVDEVDGEDGQLRGHGHSGCNDNMSLELHIVKEGLTAAKNKED